MSELQTGQKVLEWITLGLAVVFIVIGIGVLSGTFFPGKMFLGDNFRTVMGLVLIGYGILRITMIARKLRSQKRRNPFAKNP